MGGILYIVATPIGNLEDITLRALRILKEVDLIAAEDTRHSLKLLNHYGISKPLISYWSEKEKIRSEELIQKLRSGLSVALISDAGTPGISDPGHVLIQRALEEGFQIVPVPGASALTAALSVAGLSTAEFVFVGFMPPKSSHRQKALRSLMNEQRTLIFYEAPHRIIETLADMSDIFGARRAAIFREITKFHEEAFRGTLPELVEKLEQSTVAGEYVLVVEGMQSGEVSFEAALAEAVALMKKGKGRKEAVKIIAEQYGLSKKELYDRSLDV